jgi:hypothetical protein
LICSELGVRILLNLNEHDALRILQLVCDQAGRPDDQVGGGYWQELSAKLTGEIDANYERYFAGFKVSKAGA